MIKPFSDCVLIKQDVEERKGLIVIPKNKLFSGIVVATGPGKRLANGKMTEMPIAVGDHVLFGEYSGQPVEYEGETYLMMRAPDVIGLING